MLPSFPPLPNALVFSCPKFPTLQNLNRSLSIPLNHPRTVAGGSEVIGTHASKLSYAQPLRWATIVDIFGDDGVSTIYCHNIWSISYFAPHGLTSYTNLSTSQDGELMGDEQD